VLLHATLICSDEACAVELEAWGESMEELDLLVCDGCGCVLEVLALAEADPPGPRFRPHLARAA
jgi:hypothetical protein